LKKMSNEDEQAVCLYDSIQKNGELQTLEIEGFQRGVKRKKTLDMTLDVLFESLGKQYRDFARAYRIYDREDMKRCLADLRNVAGCFFLKLIEKKA